MKKSFGCRVAAAWMLMSAWAGGLTAAPAGPRFLRLAPERTVAILHTPDWRRLKADVRKSPSYAMWKDPQVQRFLEKPLAKLRQRLEEWENEAGFKVADFGVVFQREMLVACTSMDFQRDLMRVALIADVGDRGPDALRLIDKLIEKFGAEGIEKGSEDFMGETLYRVQFPPEQAKRIKVDELVYAVVDGVLLVSDDREAVKSAAAKLRGSAGPSLTDDETFRFVQEKIGAYDIGFFVDIQKILAAADRADRTGEARKVIDHLGLRGARAAGSGLDIAEDRVVVRGFFYAPAPRKGLMKILVQPAGDVAPPAFVPKEVASYAAFRFSPLAAWREAMNMMRDISPSAYGFVQGYIQAWSANPEAPLRLEDELLAPLGPLFLDYESIDPSAESSKADAGDRSAVFVIQVRNRSAFEAGLASLKKLGGGAVKFSSQDYMGYKIEQVETRNEFATVKPNQTKPEEVKKILAFALTDNYLVLGGDVEAVRGCLRRLGGSADSLRDNPDFQKVAALLPGPQSALAFSDERKAAESFGEILRNPALRKALEEVAEESLDEWVDLSLAPDPKVLAKYFYVTAGCLVPSDDGVLYFSVSPYGPAARLRD